MKWKLGLALIVAAATLQLSSSQSQAQFPLAGNSISRLVNSARLNGQTALKLAAPMTLPPMVPTLADAFQEYTVVRALVSASMPGVVGDHHIFTFYKLYALEVLSRQTKIEEEPLHLDIPPALLPLVHSEILLRVKLKPLQLLSNKFG